MANLWTFFLSLLAVAVPFLDSNVLEQQNADRVLNLPGTPPVKFRHYAGHIDLNSSKSMFYWFFESEDGAAQKPLVLWLNGGPGCSSVAEGAAQEIGPFLLEGSDQFVRNPFSWSKAANMLFLETPVGVGFSYSKNSIDYERVSDQSAAEDNFDFLVNWYARFPDYKLNKLYISGESYAGHFAPQLAQHILERNGVATKGSLIINLKGIMMGNPVINDVTDMQGTIDFAWSHGIGVSGLVASSVC